MRDARRASVDTDSRRCRPRFNPGPRVATEGCADRVRAFGRIPKNIPIISLFSLTQRFLSPISVPVNARNAPGILSRVAPHGRLFRPIPTADPDRRSPLDTSANGRKRPATNAPSCTSSALAGEVAAPYGAAGGGSCREVRGRRSYRGNRAAVPADGHPHRPRMKSGATSPAEAGEGKIAADSPFRREIL